MIPVRHLCQGYGGFDIAYALVTVDRAENADEPERLRDIFAGLEAVVGAGLPVVLPLHPRTRKQAETLGLRPNTVRMLEPVSYLDMLVLEKNDRVIVTDSGGVQKEAFFSCPLRNPSG